MWNYSERVVDHFLHPRNVGEVENPDGVGEVGSLACGDVLRITFKLDDKGRIADIRFKTFGCASAIASASALTEMAKGKTLAEAEEITNRDIAEYLGGLPDQKMHCSVLGREALGAAIYNCRTGKHDRRRLEGKVVCKCFGVTEKEIERVVRENRLTSVEEVTHYTKAGGACGQCHGDIAAVIEKVWKDIRAKEAGEETMTLVQKIRLIEKVLDEEVRPALRMDGGDIELVDVRDNQVLVRLRGGCSGCPMAGLTLKRVVEEKLRQAVSRDIVVEDMR